MIALPEAEEQYDPPAVGVAVWTYGGFVKSYDVGIAEEMEEILGGAVWEWSPSKSSCTWTCGECFWGLDT